MVETPTVRDFQTRPRGPTITIPDANDENGSARGRRHSAVSAATGAQAPHSPRFSVDNASLKRRITRSNTVRNYHSPTRPTWEEPGAEPGVDTEKEAQPHFELLQQHCDILVVDFSEKQIAKTRLDNTDLADFLSEPKEDWVQCRWISVNGLSWDVIRTLGNDKHLHRLAIEDLMNTRGRTKSDWYADQAFSKSNIHIMK
jgi:hypothetical protein